MLGSGCASIDTVQNTATRTTRLDQRFKIEANRRIEIPGGPIGYDFVRFLLAVDAATELLPIASAETSLRKSYERAKPTALREKIPAERLDSQKLAC